MKNSATLLGLILAFLTVGACGAGAITPSAQVSGVVSVGPMCPLKTCPDEAVPNVKVAFMQSKSEYDATTDSSGHFSLQMPPGDYSIKLTGVNPALPQLGTIQLYPMAGPETIRAQSGQNLTLTFRIYSGIA